MDNENVEQKPSPQEPDMKLNGNFRSSMVNVMPWMEMSDTEADFNAATLKELDSIKQFFIYKNIKIFDKLFDSPQMTDHWFTIRNSSYKIILLIGTEGNRTPGTCLPFTLRAVDQYNRLVFVLKKHFSFCFMKQVMDVEFPAGKQVARIISHKQESDELIFKVFESKGKRIKYNLYEKNERRRVNEFRVLGPTGKVVANIKKRYEKIKDREKGILYEDHYTKVNLEDDRLMTSTDKALLLSMGLIVNIFIDSFDD